MAAPAAPISTSRRRPPPPSKLRLGVAPLRFDMMPCTRTLQARVAKLPTTLAPTATFEEGAYGGGRGGGVAARAPAPRARRWEHSLRADIHRGLGARAFDHSPPPREAAPPQIRGQRAVLTYAERMDALLRTE